MMMWACGFITGVSTLAICYGIVDLYFLRKQSKEIEQQNKKLKEMIENE